MRISSPAVRVALVSLACAVAGQRASAPEALFAAGGPLAPSTSQVLPAETKADRGIERSRLITIDFDALPDPRQRPPLAREPALPLELFPDLSVLAVFDRFDPNPDGVTWVGHIEGVPMSTVTLVYSGGLMAGSVVTPGGAVRIRPAAADVRRTNSQTGRELHVVSRVSQAALWPEARPVEIDLSPAARAQAAEEPMADTADVIDVMVLFTPRAAANAGGATAMTNLINLGVSETNTSYANSGIQQRLRLVHSAEMPYTEVNSFSTNLNNLRIGAGTLGGVAALRETYRADLVMLLVDPATPDACGIAYLMTTVSTAFAPFGFSVSDTSCVSPNYTFAHELGHNMGARHDWYVDGGATPFSYAHGYVNPTAGQRWRTIMAYPDLCTAQGFNCPRLLAWANPDNKYHALCTGRGLNCAQQLQYWFVPGTTLMGIPGGTRTTCQPGNVTNVNCDADDRRALNNTGLAVANFRQGIAAAARR